MSTDLTTKIERFGYDPAKKRIELGDHRVHTNNGVCNFELSYLPTDNEMEIRHTGCNGVFKTYTPAIITDKTNKEQMDLRIKETLLTLGTPLGKVPKTPRENYNWNALSNPTGQ